MKLWEFQQFPETCMMQESNATCRSWKHCDAWFCSIMAAYNSKAQTENMQTAVGG